MIDLGEFAEPINVAITEGSPCLVATATKDGAPSLSYKGSVMVFDSTRLAFWERAHGETLRHIKENPQVAVFYRNRERQLQLRFHGRATLHESGPVRDQIMARTVQGELDRDPERKGIGVMIEVDRVTVPGRGDLQTR
ncbi:MAG: pyridoxamine 5'-phosphate oxidase family protein [Chloroflexota bacterium]